MTAPRHAVLAFVLTALLSSCTEGPSGPDFHAEARAMRSLTSVAGTHIVSSSDVESGPASLSYTWELEGNVTWDAYKDALMKAFENRPHFQARKNGDGSLSFARMLPGDLHTLHAEALVPGPPLRVRVTFRGSAD